MAGTHALWRACKVVPAYSPCQVWESCILGIAVLSLTVELLQKCLQGSSQLWEGLQQGQELQAGDHPLTRPCGVHKPLRGESTTCCC